MWNGAERLDVRVDGKDKCLDIPQTYYPSDDHKYADAEDQNNLDRFLCKHHILPDHPDWENHQYHIHDYANDGVRYHHVIVGLRRDTVEALCFKRWLP